MNSALMEGGNHVEADAFADSRRPGLGRQEYTFEIYRADEVAGSSTNFARGDWRWRLVDRERCILAEAGGYHDRSSCRQAVSHLGRFASSAKVLDDALNSGVYFAPTSDAPEPEPTNVVAIAPNNRPALR